ncbi:hypothetical protein NL676_012265 [Syzygium grande]|nr:hypothetical protein NL676_012265 [Syzygium grande]
MDTVALNYRVPDAVLGKIRRPGCRGPHEPLCFLEFAEFEKSPREDGVSARVGVDIVLLQLRQEVDDGVEFVGSRQEEEVEVEVLDGGSEPSLEKSLDGRGIACSLVGAKGREGTGKLGRGHGENPGNDGVAELLADTIKADGFGRGKHEEPPTDET